MSIATPCTPYSGADDPRPAGLNCTAGQTAAAVWVGGNASIYAELARRHAAGVAEVSPEISPEDSPAVGAETAGG